MVNRRQRHQIVQRAVRRAQRRNVSETQLSGLQRPRMALLVGAGLLALAAGCASTQYPFKLVDARSETRFGDSKTTTAGAEVILADDDVHPSLTDRFAARLAQDAGPRLTGRTVRIDRADATLFVEEATAGIPIRSTQRDEIVVLKHVRETAKRRVMVEYAGTIDGVPFSGSSERDYVWRSGDVELSRAIDAAVKAAVADVQTKLN